MIAGWGYWLRRGIAFVVDFTLADTVGELFTNAVIPPVHPAFIASLGPGVVFVYWFVSEWVFGTTVGKRIAGLRLVGPAGVRPSFGASLARGGVIALVFGGDLFEMARSVVGPRVPQGLQFASIGLMAGYLAHAGLLAALRRPAPLLHDRLSRTRVLGRRVEPESESVPTRPGWRGVAASGTAAALCLSLGVLVAVGCGLWSDGGFEWRRLREPEWRNDQFERAIVHLIAREVGVRSQVNSVRERRRTADAPEAMVGTITITLPWGAYGDHVMQTAQVVLRNIRLDPRLFDRVELVVRSGLSGVVHLDVTSQWTYVADSTKTHLVPLPGTVEGTGR